MNQLRLVRILTACMLLMIGSRSYSAVEWRAGPVIPLAADPVDVAVSPDGQWTFVLTSAGDVHVYSAEGSLKGTLHVGKGFATISSSTRGDRLYLSSKTRRSLEIVEVEFVQEIGTAGAPSKGPPNARVTVAVFSDFQ